MSVVLAGPHAVTLLEALGALDGADVAMVPGVPAALAAQAADPHARVVWVGEDRPPEPEAAGFEQVDHAALVADPRGELPALCERLGLRYDAAALGPYEALARAADGQDELAFGSVSTPSFGDRLRALGATLAITTYQAGRLVLARPEPDGGLNTHFRAFERPMGLAARPGGLALGLGREVVHFRALEDAYLPRRRHVTGDIAVHEMAWAGDELWLVATAFSCLATLDADHSFVPRWVPPWIERPAHGDACHLNGLEVVDGRPAYVTALGTTTEPGGWRARKADGGVLVDVASGEVVVAGLSMPHSPRWHGGRLWVLESGRGTLSVVDLDAGRAEPVAEFPGFTRGLAFAGPTAFVGLSQIRESRTFGALPITERLTERRCGVWTVDLTTGAIDGFLRFDDVVQEVFDVALLPHPWPDVLEPADDRVAATYVLP